MVWHIVKFTTAITIANCRQSIQGLNRGVPFGEMSSPGPDKILIVMVHSRPTQHIAGLLLCFHNARVALMCQLQDTSILSGSDFQNVVSELALL